MLVLEKNISLLNKNKIARMLWWLTNTKDTFNSISLNNSSKILHNQTDRQADKLPGLSSCVANNNTLSTYTFNASIHSNFQFKQQPISNSDDDTLFVFKINTTTTVQPACWSGPAAPHWTTTTTMRRGRRIPYPTRIKCQKCFETKSNPDCDPFKSGICQIAS